MSFSGPFSGACWIIGLDEKTYFRAVVGHPSHQFFWILVRTLELPPDAYQKILG